MCGKFTQKRSRRQSWCELHDLLDLVGKADDGTEPEAVTPMRFADVIRRTASGGLETVAMRWGFAALGAANPSKPDHIHARAETIDAKPTFRDAFRERRGLVLVDSFNEGEEVTPSKTRQHVVAPRDGKPLAIAVLWEAWQHPSEGELLTFAMVTVPANTLIGRITDRMPAVLEPDDWAAWLGLTDASSEELKAALRPLEGDWEMAPAKRPPPLRRPVAPQGELF